MSLAEIVHRVMRSAHTKLERARGPRGATPAPNISRLGRLWISIDAEAKQSFYIESAKKIASGRLRLFSLINYEIGEHPTWNRDPRTGVDAPLTFGKTLDYRNSHLVGNIKYLWEPNRHLHLVTLAQSYHLSRDEHYLHILKRHLETWFNQCPYPLGPNWSSSLELGIRLINWSLVWQWIGGLESILFRGVYGEAFRDRWLESVYQHSEFISGHFSLYSSANNHLTGEAAGLFIAAVTWPHWNISSRWRDTAHKILEREALLQNTADGVNREQAVSYQQFVLDFLILAGLAGRANEVDFTSAYWARIEAMIAYLASIMDVAGNVPMIGDADDGFVVRLSMEPSFDPYRSLLATGAVLFKRADFKAKAASFDDKSRWLLGETAAAAFEALPAALPSKPQVSFPEGGYYILGSDLETDKEIRIVADAGPLGYLSIAAHGHADALSFTLAIGGTEFLVDPGTYSYHTQKQWRDYFRGTSAHNTICVDGLDQSVSGGNFMWLQKANAVCRLWQPGDEVDEFEAMHDGYARLPDPVIHRRRIRLEKKQRLLLVDDSIECAGSHRLDLFWHFSEHCMVTLRDNQAAVLSNGKSIRILLPQHDGAVSHIYEGSASPIAGWISRHFDQKTPAPTIVWEARVRGATRLHTTIQY